MSGRSRFILVRKDHVLCTVCGKIEPVHAGHGTPMPTLLIAYQGCVDRHSRCVQRVKKARQNKCPDNAPGVSVIDKRTVEQKDEDFYDTFSRLAVEKGREVPVRNRGKL